MTKVLHIITRLDMGGSAQNTLLSCKELSGKYEILLEVVSKPQIRFKGKAQVDRESAAYIGYVSIYRRLCCTLIQKIRCESRLRGNAAIGP
jgi:hypothetical protein